MKTKITAIIMILLLPLFQTDASGAMKIESGSKGQISGFIRNASLGQPLKNVSVTVYSAADSLMVAGTITNGDGSFVLCMLSTGSYILEISYPGFIKRSIPGLIVRTEYPGVELGEIQLFPDETAVKRKMIKKQQMFAGSLNTGH